MASKSRGAIEEGSVTFNNESEKLVNFAASSFQNQGFPFVPVVKVISVDGSGIGNGNANIGVTFSNVTKTSMTVQTTVPFTGVIRYLCSVQG